MSTATATRTAIVTEGLRKAYGDAMVLDGLDLAVEAGTVFALLGPNGAGKTTLVQILSTLIPADGGVARVGGFDVAQEGAAVRARIGVTGQASALDDLLTGRENLALMARLHRLDRAAAQRRIDDLLARFDLEADAGKAAAAYSGGMRRRLDLAMTLVGDPEILFLDEPTTGLDPRSRRAMWDIVRELAGSGVTVFLTTQYLEEADHLAHHVAVLDSGRIVAQGTPTELKRLVPGGHVRLQFADAAQLDAAARAFPRSTPDQSGLSLQVPSDGGVPALRALLDTLDHGSLVPDELSVHLPDLDDVFLSLTGHRHDERS
ncbi:MAG: ATP-binding cassette domain-containing protein [Frankiales bacterium]|nr:ATP-binding cassette domain-containing protein [Frankiales bacterium]